MIVDEGWIIDPETGIVISRHLEPDIYSRDSAPLYVYNRSVRFRELCYKYVSCQHVSRIMRVFCSLEELWQKDKNKYSTTRKYFLSQKLLCKEIASYIGVKCKIRRPIHDKKRLKSQMDILGRLFKDFLLIKTDHLPCLPKCISDNNPNNITLDPAQSYPWPAGKLPATPLEMLELLTTSKLRWRSSLGQTIRPICYGQPSSQCRSTQNLQPSPRSQ